MSLARNTAFALLMGLEDDLSRVIVRTAQGNTSPLVAAETDKATERRQKELGPQATDAPWSDLLYYLDLGQKIEIINRITDQLVASLGLDSVAVRQVTGALTPLVPVRNRVCHARPLEEEDYPLIVTTVNQLLATSAFPFDELARVYQRLRTSSNDYPFT